MTVLETERLTLRQAEVKDVETLLDLFTDPRAMRFQPAAKNEAEAKIWIQTQQDSYRQNGHGIWIAALKETGEAVGVCGLTAPDESRNEVEISYSFRRCLWGRELAEEAAQGCREYGATKFGYHRFVTRIGPASVAVRRVAEKLGMELDAQQMQEDQLIVVYAIAAT